MATTITGNPSPSSRGYSALRSGRSCGRPATAPRRARRRMSKLMADPTYVKMVQANGHLFEGEITDASTPSSRRPSMRPSARSTRCCSPLRRGEAGRGDRVRRQGTGLRRPGNGLPTAFVANLYGPFGAVAWLTGADSMAERRPARGPAGHRRRLPRARGRGRPPLPPGIGTSGLIQKSTDRSARLIASGPGRGRRRRPRPGHRRAWRRSAGEQRGGVDVNPIRPARCRARRDRGARTRSGGDARPAGRRRRTSAAPGGSALHDGDRDGPAVGLGHHRRGTARRRLASSTSVAARQERHRIGADRRVEHGT